MVDFLELVEKAFGQTRLEELIELQTLRAMAAYLDSRESSPPAEAREGHSRVTAHAADAPNGDAARGSADHGPGIELLEVAPIDEVASLLKQYPAWSARPRRAP
jgi:hypothetical protein